MNTAKHMDSQTVVIVVGTRPNYLKVTRFKEVFSKYKNFKIEILHTGQHYESNVASGFYNSLGLKIDHQLILKRSNTPAQMSEDLIKKLELKFLEIKPNLIIVVGDVTSTLAAATVAKKLSIKLAHVESGLRSFDNEMPEEINRIKTDAIADYLFVTEQSGITNLINEGIPRESIFFVGNTMIDSLVKYKDAVDHAVLPENLARIIDSEYALVTFHRPSNVDDLHQLKKLIDLLKRLTKKSTVLFPIHPRTLKSLETHSLYSEIKNINSLILFPALEYFEFQKLVANAKYILTDSGGIQEETTFLKIPCITFRENTERPVTCEIGTNTLIGTDIDKVENLVDSIFAHTYKTGEIPDLWDGKATERIVEILCRV